MKIHLLFLISILITFFSANGFGQTYDIYATNTQTGEVKQLTFLDETDEYNANWSPDGKYIVHDVKGASVPFGHSVFITNVETGESTPLLGGEGGNDPVWSPDGQWIVFDRDPPFGDPPDDQSLYIVSAMGGIPRLITGDAVNADWSPTGNRLVFQRPSDGSLRTISIAGGQGMPLLDGGYNPAWSPDGKWVALDYGNIYKLPVGTFGLPKDYPAAVFRDPNWQGSPTWSHDSQNIAFHSNIDGGVDIWMISVNGGTPVKVAGTDNFDEYDPSFAKNSSWVAYAGFTEPQKSKLSQTTEVNLRLQSYKLLQNYPNPFNPQTRIPYQVAEDSKVEISVYNTLGKKVAGLVNEFKSAGFYSVDFNAENLPGGIYFYTMLTGKGFTQTRKLVILK